MKKIVISILCLSLLFPNLSIAKTFKKATLSNGKNKVAVTLGTIEAKYYASTGYKLYAQKKGLFGSAIPVVPALYESSLASPVAVVDTSMTLVRGMDRSGTALSGYMCFTIDSGSPQVEYVCGTVAGTAVTSMLRGIDPITGVTSVASLIYTHRRGASVKVTDYPVLSILARILNGDDTLPNKLKYSASTTFSGADTNQTIMPKSYIDAGFNQGAATGTEAAAGIWQGASPTQMASGTALGSAGYNLTLQNKYAISNPLDATTSSAADQQQIITGDNVRIGDAGGGDYRYAQSFVPTYNYITGINVRKTVTSGSPAGNIVFEIRTSSSTSSVSPNAVLSSKTFSPSTWGAIALDTNIFVKLPTSVSPGTKYWIVISTDQNETSGNYYRVYANPSSLFSGTLSLSTNSGAWSNVAGWSIYFIQYTPNNLIPVTDIGGQINPNFSPYFSPVGSITAYTASTSPNGWLLCDGTAYATTTYPTLFSILGYKYSTTTTSILFQLPNLTGRQIVMASSTVASTTWLGQIGGERTHTQTINEMPAHNHSILSTSNIFSGGGTGGLAPSSTGSITGDAGGGLPFNVMDPYLVLNYIIKY